MAIRAKYKGTDGQFLEGIPARDLDEDEYKELSKEQREAVRGSDLYNVKTESEMSGRQSGPSSPSGEPGGGD